MGKLIYITGLSGSGKTTIAKELQKQIDKSILLDGDEIRSNINCDLGYDRQSKIENIRRNNALIKLLYDQGFTIIAAFMASIKEERDKIFDLCPNYVAIQLITPLEICIQRDPKGLYKLNLNNFAGLNSKYDYLINSDLLIDTSKMDLEKTINYILDYIPN